MHIELSQHELELLDKALDAYERESASGALTTGMLSMMLTPKEERDSEKGRFTDAMAAAERETKQRRYETTLIRAKLYQAAARQSEHELEQPSAQ